MPVSRTRRTESAPRPASRPAPPSALLAGFGRQTRRLRTDQGLTLRELAHRSGLSLRFLMEIEAGRGNISIQRLAHLAAALGTGAADLLAGAVETAGDHPVIALLGLRGAGKTTVGQRLARRLRVPFVELDREIERRAGLALGEIFTLHGEEYYRRLEHETLSALLQRTGPMVLAVGGGLVTAPSTYALLRRRATTVWLKARPQDYWTRVVRQGDRRPMREHPQAERALRQLIDHRDPLYARSDVVVETWTLTPAEVVTQITASLGRSQTTKS